MAIDYSGFAAAQAAVAAIQASIARNHAGVSPEGEMATHRNPNKTNKKSAVDSLRASETTED